MTQTRQWLLNGHPRGRQIADDDFRLVTVDLPAPAPGQMLLKTRFLGFDPAQKGWMENIADYVAPMAIGDVMRGSGIAEVVESDGGPHPVGTLLAGTTGWSEYLISNGEGLTPVDTVLPPQAMLSVLGTTGVTAYCGLFKVGRPVAGDTVLVSGAAGATGSIVGQLAKVAGCRAIGIAGGAEKCAWLTEEAGYDAAIDYKAGSIREQLKAAGLTVFHVVPTLAAALKAVAAGVDGLVVEGGEGGGFKNPRDVASMVLLPLVASRVNVPIVGAGGITDGCSMVAAFALGAQGVQMGTRMVSATESPVHDNWKRAIVDAAETDTVFLNRFSKPGLRALRTERTTRLEHQDHVEMSEMSSALDLYFGGDMEASIALTGQVAGRIQSVAPVREIIHSTVNEFRLRIAELADLL